MTRIPFLMSLYTAGLLNLIVWGGVAHALGASAAAADPASAVAAYVADRLAVDAGEIRVKLLSPLAVPGEGSGAQVVDVQEAVPGVLLGEAAFVVRVAAAGQPPVPRTLRAEVTRLVPVVVAARRLPRFQVLTEDDLALRPIEVRGDARAYASAPAMLVGQRLTRSIGKDRPVTLDAVEAAPLIRRGDRVTLRLEQGNLTILAAGRAKADGVAGRDIPVANLDSNRIVYGRVIDASTVAIQSAP